LLSSQVQELTHERDLLMSRLGAARHRIDYLIVRLPHGSEAKDTE